MFIFRMAEITLRMDNPAFLQPNITLSRSIITCNEYKMAAKVILNIILKYIETEQIDTQ